MDLFSLIAAGAGVAMITAGIGLYTRALRRREARDRDALRVAQEQELDVPPTLHPVIDPGLCMGSLACVKACPEGEIIGIIDGRAKLIEGSRCIGHGECAAACPTGAITLVFGTSKRGLDLPEVSEFFETSRPGVHIIGELAGMGLIKNAVTQGVQVAAALARSVRRPAGQTDAGVCDVAIVGAGPAGIAAAAACKARGLSVRIFDQDTLGGTIAHYPRHKVVMTERIEIPGYGRIGGRTISKEDLLATFEDVVASLELHIEEKVQVNGIDGADGAFTVRTTAGSAAARKVVLALGRRGTPRTLDVPGEENTNVTYRLIDPAQYAGKRVLVVGGGDSALEAATALAEEGGASVGISYRGPAFGRCRPQNRARIAALIEQARVRSYMATQVQRIEPDAVELVEGDKTVRVANDYVIVAVGGVLPTEFLQSAGIAIERHHGTAPARQAAAAPGGTSWLGPTLFVLGLAIIGGLAWYGWDYYRLPLELRRQSPLHERLKPSGTWGHGIGVVATGVMLLTFLYAARKRLGFLGRLGRLHSWLNLHVFIGLTTPPVIAFHAAFQSNNLLATTTAASLAVVVITGLLGRYIFGLIPTDEGRLVPLGQVEERWQGLAKALRAVATTSSDYAAVQQLTQLEATPQVSGSFLSLLVRFPFEAPRAWLRARRARGLFTSRGDYAAFRRAYASLRRARFQLAFYERLRRLMTAWRAFHVVLAVLLLGIIAAHITISYYLGYRWIF